jgi:hypothetical protein
LTIIHKWTWRCGGDVRVGWDGGVRRVWRVGKGGGVEGGGEVGSGEGCFTIFKVFLYILLEPKNKIKDILIMLAALFHEFILIIPYGTHGIFYFAYDFF